jgi:hypothetical protein
MVVNIQRIDSHAGSIQRYESHKVHTMHYRRIVQILHNNAQTSEGHIIRHI